jgi:hypothetical protein
MGKHARSPASPKGRPEGGSGSIGLADCPHRSYLGIDGEVDQAAPREFAGAEVKPL